MIEWKKHQFYNNYELSSEGDIRGPRGLRKLRLDRYGYLRVNISYGGRNITLSVHRLVASAFMPNSIGETVNHIDGNKLNNRIGNLEWLSRADNTKHAFKLGIVSTCHQYKLDGILYYSKRECARCTGISRQSL